ETWAQWYVDAIATASDVELSPSEATRREISASSDRVRAAVQRILREKLGS
ncbi:MAG: hypothetical protein JNL26_09170, partial [Gemmatimonadetes bacterium]|nr:hypothetical protein [Gemmatimonadota bacterium]